jgi:hypothetical protein
MDSKNNITKITTMIAIGAMVLFGVLIAYVATRPKAEPPVPDKTFTDTELRYRLTYPGDGKRIYKTNTLGKTSLTVDAGVAAKPGQFIHTVTSVSVVPVGDSRDNGIRTDEELAQRKVERPQDGFEKTVINKDGVPGFCYYAGTEEIDKRLSCRYEYQGSAYYLSANNPPNEKTAAYFDGSGQMSLLQVGERIIRSFEFLP